MRINSLSESNRQNWDKIVNHPLQSWAWGDFRSQMGIKVERIGIFEKDKLTSGYQVTFHQIPFLPFTIGYFPKGPEINEEMINVLKDLGHKHNAIYIQIEPNIYKLDNKNVRQEDSKNFLINENSDNSLNVFQSLNLSVLKKSHHPLFTKYTFVLDLTKSEADLLEDMHPKARYNIKVATKHDVKIKEDNSDEAFENYLKLEAETTNRQKFYAHSENYHRQMWEIMKKAEIAKLWTASIGNETLAAWIVFVWKDTIYYPYGASSRNQREAMAPNLLLWEIAKWGKQNGYKQFDLWGAIGPNPNPNDPWYGFHRFKAGYNPELIEFIGSFDLIINPFLYKLYCMANSVRWKLLKIFK